MYLVNVDLHNWRNFTYLYQEFTNGINYLYGNNGVGKTNILELLSLLSVGEIFSSANNSQLIRFNMSKCHTTAKVNKSGIQHDLHLTLDPTKKKNYIQSNDIQIMERSFTLYSYFTKRY